MFFYLSVGHFVVFLCSQGDLGGERTLQKKWTSFLKARIDCPVLESRLPYIIQDTYRWCDSQKPWKDCLFYAVFTPQSYVWINKCFCVRRRKVSLMVFGTAFGSHFLCVLCRDTSALSAVCVYRVSDISRVFAEGKYKTPVTVETSFVKWVMYSGDVPAPRPGAVSLSTIQHVCMCRDKTCFFFFLSTCGLAGSWVFLWSDSFSLFSSLLLLSTSV